MVSECFLCGKGVMYESIWDKNFSFEFDSPICNACLRRLKITSNDKLSIEERIVKEELINGNE